MKNKLLFLSLVIIAIVIMAIYDFQLMPGAVAPVPPGAEAYALYVCPVESFFDSGTDVWRQVERGVNIALLSFMMLTLAVYGWILYVSLLQEKVKEDTFKIPSLMLKILIAAFVVSRLMTNTPNYYRSVHVQGSDRRFVLCESTSPGARSVRHDAVSAARAKLWAANYEL